MQMQKKAAFSMIEIMVVMMIIGTIVAALGPQVVKWMRAASKNEIMLKFSAIKNGLNEYKMALGKFPTTREGLKALVENPNPSDDRYKRSGLNWPLLEEKEVQDKAGNEFMYNCPVEKFKDRYKYYELIWYGPSGAEDDPEQLTEGA
jgi:general secretion pathway protein G